MGPVYFSIPDSWIVAWLGVGFLYTAIVDTWARKAEGEDAGFTLGQWFAITSAWPYYLWKSRRGLIKVITGE